MMTKSNIRIFIIALLMVCQGGVVCADEMIRLPLRVHIVTGVDMIREPDKTVMNMPVTVADAETIMRQVNEIWAPASIWWETDVKNGGGGVIEEVAGGGKLGDARLKELARLIAARDRESKFDYMRKAFPALADPDKNESIGEEGFLPKVRPKMYHLYLFPYVGRTLQGTARLAGTFAVVGVFSDKGLRENEVPKLRTYCVPGELVPKNFPAEGTMSATIAHELGHNLSLQHEDEGMKDNLMKGNVKLRLGKGQIEKARAQAEKGPRILRE